MIAARHDGEVVRLSGDQIDLRRLEAVHGEADREALTVDERRRRLDTRREHKSALRVKIFSQHVSASTKQRRN